MENLCVDSVSKILSVANGSDPGSSNDESQTNRGRLVVTLPIIVGLLDSEVERRLRALQDDNIGEMGTKTRAEWRNPFRNTTSALASYRSRPSRFRRPLRAHHMLDRYAEYRDG